MSTVTNKNDLEWLVASRSRIQHFLFKLYSFEKERDNSDPSQLLQFQMLMGVGFALWRAAFLADGERSWETIDEDAITFLETLVRDNAIGYPQDRTSKRWTFGYYVNDAYLRLAYFHEKLHSLKKNQAEQVMAFLDIQRTKEKNEPNSHIAWDHAYEAALDAFKNLSAKN